MSQVLIDAMTDAGPWQARTPADAPSAELTVTPAGALNRPGGSGGSLQVAATTAALDHRLRRSFAPAIDLSARDELRVWLRADRAASGSAAVPFYLELRLGSPALPVGDAANPWHRLLPVTRPGAWELVRLGIDDLPAAVRGAVDRLELRVADAASAFTLHLDELIAVKEEMLSDVEAALVAALGGFRFAPADDPVPVVLDGQAPPAPPPPALIRLSLRDLRPATERAPTTRARGDHTAGGFRLRPPPTPYELTFDIAARADDRNRHNRLLEHLLAALSSRGEVEVSGIPRPLRFQGTVPPVERPGDGGLPLRFIVATWLATGRPETVVPPFNEVQVVVDDPRSAAA